MISETPLYTEAYRAARPFPVSVAETAAPSPLRSRIGEPLLLSRAGFYETETEPEKTSYAATRDPGGSFPGKPGVTHSDFV